MAIEKKIFAGGGMDMDTDERFIPKTDYKKAVNCRISKTDEGNDGIVENIRSNALTSNSWVKTGDQCIGTYEDKSTATVIFFIYAIDGNHGIYRKTSSGSIQKILQDPILNFHSRFLITGINVVGSDEDKFPEGLLYWTDDYNPPRKINIEKARTNGYISLTEQSISVIKWAPEIQPNPEAYITDTNIESNQLKGKAWQFKYRWIYDDGEKSSWSPISITTHDNSFDPFNNSGINSWQNNVIPIGFLSGHETVLRIQIAGRNTNGIDDFILICDIDKHNVKEKVGTSKNNVNVIYNSTTPIPDGTGSWTYFYFYNDGIYSTIDVVESSKLYNDVPHLAKAQEIVDGNRLVYGNVESGQTGLDELDISLEATEPAGGTAITYNSQLYTIPMRWKSSVDVDGNTLSDRKFSQKYYLEWTFPDDADVQDDCLYTYAMNVEGFACWASVYKGVYGSNNSDREVSFSTVTAKHVSTATSGSVSMNTVMQQFMTEFTAGNGFAIDTYGGNADPSGNATGHTKNTFTPAWSISGNTLRLTISSPQGNGYHWSTNGACEQWSSQSGGNGGSIIWGSAGSWEDVNASKASMRKYGCASYAKVHAQVGCGYVNFQNANICAQETPTISSNGKSYRIPNYCTYTWPIVVDTISASNQARLIKLRTDSPTYLTDNENQYEEFCSTSSSPSLSIPSFKSGAKHRFGLVYYDKGNRSTSVQLANVSDTYIPKIPESTYVGEWHINWTINHEPPEWATHYQWVYGGNTLTETFVQFVTEGFFDGIHGKKIDPAGGASTSDYRDNILVDIHSIRKFREAEGETGVNYEYKEGDILRIVLDENDSAASVNYEFKVVGMVGEGKHPLLDASSPGAVDSSRDYLILAREFAIIPSLDYSAAPVGAFKNYTLEIYAPKKDIDETQSLYYEFGQFGNLFLIGTDLNHGKILGDSVGINQDISSGTPASGTFTRGDVFYKIRSSKSAKLFTPVESFHYNDRFKSDYWDKGRPNAVLEDFKRTRKHSTCLYSESYIPNTNINGLSSFFPDVSFQEFERDYNSIQKLHSKDNKLIIFQEDKVSQSLVNRNIIYNIDGSGNVATSDSVLSQAVPYLGNYGINKNPESFASYGNRMYFVDIQRGVVLRLANDGFTPISNYKMKNFFTDSFKAIQSLTGDKFHKIVGVYDSAFDEYVISQPGYWSYLAIIGKNGSITYVKDKHLIEAYTLGFCESSNRWNSFYSYIPEMMCAFQNGFVSFDAGNLYTHNISGKYVDSKGILKTHNTYNEFYGIEYDSELWVVSNEAPSNNKVYQSFSQESDKIWDVTFDSPNGQSTALLPSDFDTRENIHYSDIMNDVNSAGGLIEGDRIRDVTLLAKLKLFSNKLTRIFGVNFNFAPSQRSNK